jgi:endonuclease/exonuclease/phosphatase family metal-dependent hydrolase
VDRRAITWNLFHGRDFPPEASLRTWRSRLMRISERSDTHVQVNRDLLHEFAWLLADAAWDIALLQECPPRWTPALLTVCDAEGHAVLTSRNALAPMRSLLARLNPDLIGSNEGGSNLTLVRSALGEIVERRELELEEGPIPERRAMAFTRIRIGDGTATDLCVSNLHASAGSDNRALAEEELLLAAERSTEWAADAPLILGGDLNVRPDESTVYEKLAERFDLQGPTAPDALDHLLTRGLTVVEPPHTWAPEEREVRDAGGLAIRLSDHAPVEATFGIS